MRVFLLLMVSILSSINIAQAATSNSLLTGTRQLNITSSQVTWTALDISPDGQTLIFDALGDIYTLPVKGGKAKPLLTGEAFEYHPVYSPNGKRIAFLSDRSGSLNLWVANQDGSQPKQLSTDTRAMIYASPSWSADGKQVYVSKMHYSLLAFEVFAYDINSGNETRVTDATPTETEGFDSRHNVVGVRPTDDGTYLYYSKKLGTTWSPMVPPQWHIFRQSVKGGDIHAIITGKQSAMSPVPSHRGDILLYATQMGDKTTLRLRHLETGVDNQLLASIDPSGQEGGYYMGLLPRAVFSPDDQYIYTSINGEIVRIQVKDGTQTTIPMTFQASLATQPNARVDIPPEIGPVQARLIQQPAVSPDGRSIAFSAFGQLYVQSTGKPTSAKRIPRTPEHAFQPAWSADGKWLTYVTWQREKGGHIWKINLADNTAPVQMTSLPDFYQHPVFAADNQSVFALRANHYDRMHTFGEVFSPVSNNLVLVKTSKKAPLLLSEFINGRSLHRYQNTLWVDSQAGLKSFDLMQNTMADTHLVLDMSGNQYIAAKLPVEQVRISPDGQWLLARSAAQLYAIDLSKQTSGSPIDLSQPNAAIYKITQAGADYFGWSNQGHEIYWTAGSTYYTQSLADAITASSSPAALALNVALPRDVPEQNTLLRGATILTMNKEQPVIENADLLIKRNHIAALATRGSLIPDADTKVIDVSGKYIIPGLIDAHAHWTDLKREVIDTQKQWEFSVNLAYGVTAALDVQTFTADTFAYQDLIDAGRMLGPRAFSTGPGVFHNVRLTSVEDAEHILARYRDHYRTRNIKSYMVGNRQQQQYLQQAALNLGMMPTTEGASNLRLNLLHALDGFSGNEHNLPVSPLHDDVISLYVDSGISYTPTLSVMYGGAPALFEQIASENPYDSAKLHHFIPEFILDSKTRDLPRWHRNAYARISDFAKDALAIQRQGGIVAMGSHGEMQGIGMHWEMQAYATSGATPMEVLYAATMGSATAIGRASSLGSIQTGKLADLIILEQDPRTDIRHTQSIEAVMKNGRLYQGETLAPYPIHNQ